MSITVPPELHQLADWMDRTYPEDRQKAIAEWITAAKKMPEFPEWIEFFISETANNLIGDARVKRSVVIKKKAGEYGKAAKVVGGKAIIEDFKERIFDMPVDGTRLGLVLYSRLPALANRSQKTAEGHMKMSNFFNALYRRRPKKDVMIEEGISEKRANSLFESL